MRAERGLARSARARGTARSRVISLFMWFPQQISCGNHMIKVRAAVPAGQIRTERARPVGGEAGGGAVPRAGGGAVPRAGGGSAVPRAGGGAVPRAGVGAALRAGRPVLSRSRALASATAAAVANPQPCAGLGHSPRPAACRHRPSRFSPSHGRQGGGLRPFRAHLNGRAPTPKTHNTITTATCHARADPSQAGIRAAGAGTCGGECGRSGRARLGLGRLACRPARARFCWR